MKIEIPHIESLADVLIDHLDFLVKINALHLLVKWALEKLPLFKKF